MQDYIIEIIDQFGYFGILFLIAIENLFPPIPSEVILTFAGFLTTYTSMSIVGVVAVSTVGSMLGAIILYGIGRLLTPEKLEALIGSRWGRMLRFRQADVTRAVGWFSRRGSSAVFFCRFVPIVRSLISIPAGITKMPLGKFIALSTAGTLIWNTALVSIGAFLGESWEKSIEYVQIYSDLVIVSIIVLFLIFAVLYYRRRLKRNS